MSGRELKKVKEQNRKKKKKKKKIFGGWVCV